MQHRARKRFGQNFLIDTSIIERIVGTLRPEPQDNVVEVGPGLGALTEPLLQRLQTLQVVEIDRDLIAKLAARQQPGLIIHQGDVLDIDWRALHGGKTLRVVGNLPYNIGTPLLLKLLDVHPLIKDIHVMLQKEVVDRLTAKAGTRAYGRLSVIMQSVFKVQALFPVPASAFQPAPKVESAIVRLTTLDNTPSAQATSALQLATRLAFANKRKTLRNNLKGHIDDAAMESIGINPQARAETLSLEAFQALAKHLDNHVLRHK